MAWRAITEKDILLRISGTELDIMREVLLGQTQVDPVDEQITLTTNFVRGFIAACEKNTLGQSGTLPDELILMACDILVVDMNTRAGGVLVDDSGERSKAKETAISILRNNVATCKYAIAQPETATDDTFNNAVPLTTNPSRGFDRVSQDGI